MIKLNPAARLRAYRAGQRPLQDRFLFRHGRPLLLAWAAATAALTAAMIVLGVWAVRSM